MNHCFLIKSISSFGNSELYWNDWRINLDINKTVASLFIDLKKAFDLLDPEILYLILFHYGFENNSLNLMKNYLVTDPNLLK